MWFCYWTPLGDEFPKGGGIITPIGAEDNFVQGPHYAHAQRVNAVVNAWGDSWLLKAKSLGVWRAVASADGAKDDIANGSADGNGANNGTNDGANDDDNDDDDDDDAGSVAKQLAGCPVVVDIVAVRSRVG